MTIGKGVPAIEQRRNKLKVPSLEIAVAVPHGHPGGPPMRGEGGPPKRPMLPKMDPLPDPMSNPAVDAENGEDYGAKLMADLTDAGSKHGLDPEQSKTFASDVFASLAKCLKARGSDEQGEMPPMGQEDDIAS